MGFVRESLKNPEAHHAEVRKALDQFLADVKTVRRRAKGDSVIAAKGILTMMRRTGFEPYIWQRQVIPELSKAQLLEIYGQRYRLIRLLENELDDSAWSSK